MDMDRRYHLKLNRIHCLLALSLMCCSINVSAMGIRSFVALPLEQGGMIFRLQDLENTSRDGNIAIANFAYGLAGKHTLLFGIPYRFSPSVPHRSGDLSVLYRYIAWQQDSANATKRLGLLVGGLVPTNKASDGGAQAGAVATFYRDRHELDIDGVWAQGFNRSPNTARYDVSYQFRLYPAQYPESGLSAEWYAVIEYNGRWRQSNQLIHQATIGLQWIHPTWVLEGGLIQDINALHDTRIIVSARLHV